MKRTRLKEVSAVNMDDVLNCKDTECKKKVYFPFICYTCPKYSKKIKVRE